MVNPLVLHEPMDSTTSFHEFKDRVKRNYSPPADQPYSEWMLSIKVTLGMLKKRPWDLSIYKVPNKLRKLKEDAYNPHIVSIGPFHQRKQNLLAMEEHKWRYMLSLLHRTSGAERALDECGQVILSLEEAARGCYAENINLNKHELVEILMVDGCFILELLIRHAEAEEEMLEVAGGSNNYFLQDPIINNSWMVPTLQHDLGLLENQIPFAVLQNLFGIIQTSTLEQLPFSLTKYVLMFFRSALHLSKQVVDKRSSSSLTGKHLLDMLHNVYFPTVPKKNPRDDDRSSDNTWGFKGSAAQLLKSGVKFQVGDADHSLLDIKFSKGVLTIPPLCVRSETSDAIFRNLIAFEQCSSSGFVGSRHHISSYALLMKSLIRSSQDVELLGKKGIITTTHDEAGGSDGDGDGDGDGYEDVYPNFFNNICKEVVFKDFYFGGLCQEVNAYHYRSWLSWSRTKAVWKVRWRGYVMVLKEDYFTSPWTIISFIAAFALLCFTALQTYFTVLSYYHH